MATYAPCPACGTMYTIDAQLNRSCKIKCYGCGESIHYDAATISFSKVV